MTQSLRELSRSEREKPAVTVREREEPVVAVFDMEGTIITSNVVESYVWTRMADLPPDEWPGELVSVFGGIPATCRPTGGTGATSCGRSSGATRARRRARRRA